MTLSADEADANLPQAQLHGFASDLVFFCVTSASFCKESALGPVLGVSVAALSLRYQSQDPYTGTPGQYRILYPI